MIRPDSRSTLSTVERVAETPASARATAIGPLPSAAAGGPTSTAPRAAAVHRRREARDHGATIATGVLGVTAAGEDDRELCGRDVAVEVDEASAPQRIEGEGPFFGGGLWLRGLRIEQQHRSQQVPGQAALVDGAGSQLDPGGDDVRHSSAQLVAVHTNPRTTS